MKIDSKNYGGKLTIYVYGDIDEHSAVSFRTYLDKVIDDEKFGAMIINMSEVDFMDSTGIGVILGRYKKLKKLGLPMYVEELNTQIDKVFRVSGLYQIIKAV